MVQQVASKNQHKPGKTEALVFKYGKGEEIVPNLHIGQNDIAYVDHTPVLYVEFDNKLNWHYDINKVKAKPWATWLAIKRFSQKSKRLKSDTIIHPAKTYMLTKLLYAAPVWLSEHTYSFKDRLYDILKHASNAEYNPSISLLECIFNFCPLEIECKVTVKFLIKTYSNLGSMDLSVITFMNLSKTLLKSESNAAISTL